MTQQSLKEKLSPLFEKGKKFAKFAGKVYLATYALAMGAVVVDCNTFNRARINRGETVNQMIVHRYKTNVNGIEKNVTFLGEQHIYTAKEKQMIDGLVEEHDFYALECGKKCQDARSPRSDFYSQFVLGMTYLGAIQAYKYGAGRHESSLMYTMPRDGTPHISLEENSFQNVTWRDNIVATYTMIKGYLLLPQAYYYGRTMDDIVDDGEPALHSEKLMRQRDEEMAHTLYDYLQGESIDNVLVVVGQAHLPGIEYNLMEKLELQRIEN